ncbi:MAG: hypothetical protein AAGI52_04505 [Bacteroidota bacterium]
MPRLALAALLLASLSLAACDNQRNDLFGEFEANVLVDGVEEQNPDDEGDDDERDGLEGEAVYTVVQTERGQEFVIGLFVGDLFDSQFDDYQYLLFRLEGDGPSVGAYAIDDDPENSGARAIYADVQEPEDDEDRGEGEEEDDAFIGEILTGTDGVLTISYVDQFSIRGTFRFDARGLDVRNPERFLDGEASGRFEAVYERPSLVLNRGLELR